MNGFKFGVELEFNGVECNDVATYLHSRGVSIAYAGYSHQVTNHWKVVTDASVTVAGIGGELVSPILYGSAGFDELVSVVTALNSMPGIGVDRRCGLHVHVSWDGMTVAQVQSVVSRFVKYEDWFDSIQPQSRRANRFCKPLKDHPQFSAALSCSPSIRIANLGVIASDRYVKLNLNSLSRYGTIEFRQHAGTTDPTKVLNWVRFLEQFIDASINAPITASLNYKRRTQRAYAEIREQIESVGGRAVYKGGKWQLSTSDGKTVTVSNQFLDTFYQSGTRQLNEFFATFWKGFVGSQDDHVFLKVSPPLVQYFNARQARFA